MAKPRPGESPAETRRRLLAHGDDRTFTDWLGDLPGDADLMFRATVTRSTAEPEEITAGAGTGYFALVWSSGSGLSRNIVGGAATLIEAIAAELPGRIVTDAAVQEIAQEGDVVRVRYRSGGSDHELRARHAIVATKAYDAARLIRDLPGDTQSALTSIPYGPTVVMAMLTNETRPMPWDDMYALATPKRAFSMLFNTANVLRPRSAVRTPGGSLMVYRSGHAALEMFEQPDSVLEQAFLDDLYDIYPDARGIVSETILLKMPRMLPYAAPGRSALQPAPRATARSHPSRRRLPGRRLHRHRDLERPGGRPGRAQRAAGRPNHDLRRRRVRSRFNNVVNARDVPQEDYSEPSGRYQVAGREIAEAVGARDLGYSVSFVAPGSRSYPFHFHHGEEEAFYVLEGRGLLRQGDGEGAEELIELGPGDVVAFPAATGIAHQFINDGDAPFVYLAISNKLSSDVAEFPDSDKVLIRSTRLMVRRSPRLEYFDGEL